MADVAHAPLGHLGLGLADDQVREARTQGRDDGLGIVRAEELVAERGDLRLHVLREHRRAEQLAPLRHALAEQPRPHRLVAEQRARRADHLVRILDEREARAILPGERGGLRRGLRGDDGRSHLAQRREAEQEAEVRLVHLVRHRGALALEVQIRAQRGAIGVRERGEQRAAIGIVDHVEPQELLDEPRERAFHRLRGFLDLDLVAGRQPRYGVGIGQRHPDTGARECLVALPHGLLRGGVRGQAEEPERRLAELAEPRRAEQRAVGLGLRHVDGCGHRVLTSRPSGWPRTRARAPRRGTSERSRGRRRGPRDSPCAGSPSRRARSASG